MGTADEYDISEVEAHYRAAALEEEDDEEEEGVAVEVPRQVDKPSGGTINNSMLPPSLIRFADTLYYVVRTLYLRMLKYVHTQKKTYIHIHFHAFHLQYSVRMNWRR